MANINSTFPAGSATAISLSDSTELTTLPRALYVGTGGTVVVKFRGAASTVTFSNVANGQVLDIRPAFVYSTGTTASGIVGLY